MRTLIDWIRHSAYGLNLAAGVILIATMVVVLAEILLRSLFGLTGGRVDLTFTGSFELVRWGMLLSLAYCMPYTLPRAQVVVDLFTDNLPDWMKERLKGFYTLLFGVFGLLMVWLMIKSGQGAAMNGETSQDLLIPMQYIYYLASIGMLLLGLRGFALAYEEFFLTDGSES